MKMLVLITALLLVLQAQAESLLGAAEEAPDQMQPSEEDPAMSISFGGFESFGLQEAGEHTHNDTGLEFEEADIGCG
ncbi:Alpha-defensin 29 [Lemmus lemmus]